MDAKKDQSAENVDGRTLAGKKRPHDAEGHFVHVDKPDLKNTENSATSLVKSLIPHDVSFDKKADDDTLLDIHLGNPLRKITKLLEEIKKEKAFSFSIKGSLGLAGIVLVLGTFGFLGGSRLLCSKGSQSSIGTLKQLQILDNYDQIPVLTTLVNAFNVLLVKDITVKSVPRVVLVRSDSSVVRIPPNKAVSISAFLDSDVIVTGEYDSCSQTITVTEPGSVQSYQ